MIEDRLTWMDPLLPDSTPTFGVFPNVVQQLIWTDSLHALAAETNDKKLYIRSVTVMANGVNQYANFPDTGNAGTTPHRSGVYLQNANKLSKPGNVAAWSKIFTAKGDFEIDRDTGGANYAHVTFPIDRWFSEADGLQLQIVISAFSGSFAQAFALPASVRRVA